MKIEVTREYEIPLPCKKPPKTTVATILIANHKIGFYHAFLASMPKFEGSTAILVIDWHIIYILLKSSSSVQRHTPGHLFRSFNA